MLCRLFEQLYLPNNNRSKTSRSFCISGKTLSPTYHLSSCYPSTDIQQEIPNQYVYGIQVMHMGIENNALLV